MGVTALLLAGTGLMAAGQYQQGQAAKVQGKSEQILADFNAAVTERAGQAENKAKEYQAAVFEEQGLELLGEQKVAQARSGTLSTVGTPELVRKKTITNLDIDKRMILREGELAKSYAYSQATGMRLQGKAAKLRGKYAARGATLSAAGTILTGLGMAGYMGSGGKLTTRIG